MLDVKLIRKSPELVKEKLLLKGYEFDAHRFNSLDSERLRALQQIEALQNKRNSQSKLIGKEKRAGGDVTSLLKEIEDLGQDMESIKESFARIDQEYQQFLLEIPNLPSDDIVKGRGEEDNIEISSWGDPSDPNEKVKDHVELTAKGYLDFETASKITGSRFIVMRGAIARLHRALIQFMLDFHTNENGFAEVYVPYIVNSESLLGTGQLPKFESDQFKLQDPEGWYLIPTGEVPVTNMYRDTIIDEENLPVKHVSHTPCFRSEAGSYGRDTKGMIRQHQFEKVELVMLSHPEKSWEALEELSEAASLILKRLELPFRTMVLCGTDLGFSSAKTIDLEVWLPGQQRYREISSCSNFLEFQARRLKARFRNKSDKKISLVHTLNGSGLAVGRTLVAIIENYQDEEGRITIPDCLRQYMGGLESIDLNESA